MMAAGASHTHQSAHHPTIEEAIERLSRYARPFDNRAQDDQVVLSRAVGILGAVVIIALLAFVALIR